MPTDTICDKQNTCMCRVCVCVRAQRGIYETMSSVGKSSCCKWMEWQRIITTTANKKWEKSNSALCIWTCNNIAMTMPMEYVINQLEYLINTFYIHELQVYVLPQIPLRRSIHRRQWNSCKISILIFVSVSKSFFWFLPQWSSPTTAHTRQWDDSGHRAHAIGQFIAQYGFQKSWTARILIQPSVLWRLTRTYRWVECR